mgnify:CR=1 FL=1
MDFDKLTDRARGFLQAAQTIAVREHHQRVTPGHYAKALLDDDQGMATGLIDASGGDGKAARREVDALVTKEPTVTGSGANSAPGVDGDLLRILDNAQQIATKAGDSYVTVERILLDGAPEAVALRASMVIGHGSRSFDFLASIVERLPVLALPGWRDNRSRPIDSRDVVEYLAQAGTQLPVEGARTFDVGGATELSYGDMVLRIAELAGTPRPSFGVPLSITPVASRVGAAIAGEDPGLIEPLMDSLEYSLIPDDRAALAAFEVEPRPFDEAVRWALEQRARE